MSCKNVEFPMPVYSSVKTWTRKTRFWSRRVQAWRRRPLKMSFPYPITVCYAVKSRYSRRSSFTPRPFLKVRTQSMSIAVHAVCYWIK